MYLAFVDAIPNIYFGIGLGFTTFFMLQTVFTLIGAVGDEDMSFDEDFSVDEDFSIDEDINFDEDGSGIADSTIALHLFTVRGILGFFMLFGWTGYILEGVYSPIIVFIIAVISGVITMFLISVVVFFLYKLAQDGTLDIKESIGIEGTVYLTIPVRKSGTGKVQIIIGNSLRTMDAVASDSSIPSGKRVRVIALEGDLLVVEEIIEDKREES